MTDDLRWAARYAFCEDLWRGRSRIVWDRRVEASLWSTPAGDPGRDEQADPEALTELLDALVPRFAPHGARRRVDVSMGVSDEAAARRLAPRRTGTQFLGLAALCDAIRHRDWEVALIDLSDLLVGDETASRLSVRGNELVAALASRMRGSERAVVLTCAAEGGEAMAFLGRRRRSDPAITGLDYDAWLAAVAEIAPHDVTPRVYGLLQPTMVAMVELPIDDAEEEPYGEHTVHVTPPGPAPDSTAPRIEDDVVTTKVRGRRQLDDPARRGSGAWRDGKPRGARWSEELGDVELTRPLRRTLVVTAPAEQTSPDAGLVDEDDVDDVPLSFDNTLGAAEPTIVEYVAIIGVGDVELAEGMTLVELPTLDLGHDPKSSSVDPMPTATFDDEVEGTGALRLQLTESRRQADLASIERQGLVERVDDLESANTTLRSEVGELRDRLARALSEPSETSADHQQRLDVAQAELQSARWELTRTRRALDAARAQPVDTLEAEVARLRAMLGASGMREAAVPADRPPEHTGDVSPPAAGLSVETVATNGRTHRPSQAGPLALLASVDALLKRVERSDISALELRQALVSLRRGLARLLPTA